MTTPDPEAALRAAFARRRRARRARDRRTVEAIRDVAARAETTAAADDVPEARREALERDAEELRELADDAEKIAGLDGRNDQHDDGEEAPCPGA